MKKTLTALLILTILIMAALPASAEHYWDGSMKFTAAYGTVNIDGKIEAGEWDEAQVIAMRLNNDPLAAQGKVNYQGEWADGRSDSDYSGDYKIKWDENYIYYLEDRNDDHICLAGDGMEPYLTDGVLIFTQVDSADGKQNPDGISVHVFYSVGNGSGQIGGDVKARVCNIGDGSRETIDIPGAKITSALKTGGYIVEIAVPWSFYTSLVPEFKGPAAGMLMGLSYVVHDSDSDDTGFIKQLCYAIDNDNLGDVPGGYDFGSWGTLELLAAPPAPEPEPAPAPSPDSEAAGGGSSAPEQPVVTAPAAPKTGDGTAIFALLIFVSAAGIIAAGKRLYKNI